MNNIVIVFYGVGYTLTLCYLLLVRDYAYSGKWLGEGLDDVAMALVWPAYWLSLSWLD